VEFDESVDRYGAAVAGAGGVEGGQEGGPQRLSVHPSRAISGIEQPGKLPMILIANSRRTPS